MKSYQTLERDGFKSKKKKFNEEEFQKQLKSFELWEKKRNEKIENLKKKKVQKELDSVNNKKNIHYNKKMPNDKLPSVLERLYTKDIEKRRQNKQILTKIYTPSFTPFLYSKGDHKKYNKKPENQNRNQSAKNRYNHYKNYNTIDENNDNENSDNNEENHSDNDYEKKKKKKVKLIKIKKAKSKGRTKKVNAKVRFTVDESSDDDEDRGQKEEIEEIQHDRAEVENAMRNRLFRNKSATKRKVKL